MPYKPQKWFLVLLGILLPPLALMYVARWRWAIFYVGLGLLFGWVGEFYFSGQILGFAPRIVLSLACVIHAWHFSRRYPENRPRPAYSRWYGLLGATLGVFTFFFAMSAFVVELFRNPSGGMLPTIPAGSMLLVQKWGYGHYGAYGIPPLRLPISAALKRGDMVVFESPPNPSVIYAKRVIGLPGDTVVYRNKQLAVNGVAAQLSPQADYQDVRASAYFPALIESLDGLEYSVLVDRATVDPTRHEMDFPLHERCVYDSTGLRCMVPPGHYFVMGDNRDQSIDSRQWGFVPADHIVGKVIHIVRP